MQCRGVGLEGSGLQGLFSNSCNDESVVVFVVHLVYAPDLSHLM